MTAIEYLKRHIKVVNNCVYVKEIEEGGPFCQTCWEKKQELEPTSFDQRRNGWVCKHGHFGPNGGLPASGVVYTGGLP